VVSDITVLRYGQSEEQSLLLVLRSSESVSKKSQLNLETRN